MYTDGYVRVITEQPLVGSVPLAELLGDDNWVNAVKASHLSNYYLSNVKYEEFISHSESRVLSYRWKNKISLDCVVSDPAGILSRFRGDIALSVLETPLGEWKYLWADALNHLNDPEGVGLSIQTMGALYLQVTTLPQYFMQGDLSAAKEAISRGWMHQELAYGALDRSAIYSFIGICAKEIPHMWRGNPFYMPSFMALQQFVAKRVRAPWTQVAEGTKFAAVLHAANPTGSWSGDYTWAMHSGRVLSYWQKLHDLDTAVYQDFRDAVDKDLCLHLIDEFIDIVAAKQLSDDIDVNMDLLKTSPSFCYGIIKAACNTNFWDKSDSYVATISVIGSACGIPIKDPLAEYKVRFEYSDIPRNPDFTLKYSPSDINLDSLNSNLKILRICWNTLNVPDLKLPYALKTMNPESRLLVKLSELPPGMHTLGVGSIRNDNITDEKNIFQVNRNYAFLFSDSRDSFEIVSSSGAPQLFGNENKAFHDILSFYSGEMIQNMHYQFPDAEAPSYSSRLRGRPGGEHHDRDASSCKANNNRFDENMGRSQLGRNVVSSSISIAVERAAETTVNADSMRRKLEKKDG